MPERSFGSISLPSRAEQLGPENPRFASTDGSIKQMNAEGAWLLNGSVVLDEAGRVIQGNDEFTFWSGSSTLVFPSFVELMAGHCEEWRSLLEELLADKETFLETTLEDTSVQPSHWYKLQITTIKDCRAVRLARSLPPAPHITECSWLELMESPQARQEVYSRMLRAEAQLKMLGGKWPGVLFTQRPDFTFTFVSEKIEEWTGIPVQKWGERPERFWDAVHEADASELQSQISLCKGGQPVTATFRLRHIRTGRVTYVLERREAIISGNGLILGYDGAWVDVTRQTIAEKRLGSAVWKETLGLLTMGLAHDFNNILSGIYSLSETYHSMAEDEPGSPFKECFSLIRKNSMQASHLVQRILSLHQGKVGTRNYHDANELVNDTVEVIRKTLRRICIHTELYSEQLPLYIDPIEFRQVLVNLALNAADAMPDGGDLYFITSHHQTAPKFTVINGVVPRTPAVCITVRDTGTGIPLEYLPHIFDPFFTTKPLNKGSGLGLYNARLFVEKHNGGMTVDSIENFGTTFRIWLPVADFTEAEMTQKDVVQTRKTLLLLEPSGKTLEPAAQCLRECGFYVATTSNERGAIELLHSPEYQFDAVMVVINGVLRLSPRIFNEITRLKLPIKTIVQIAGSNEDDHDSSMLVRADLVIGSEVPPLEIAAKVREVLNCPA